MKAIILINYIHRRSDESDGLLDAMKLDDEGRKRMRNLQDVLSFIDTSNKTSHLRDAEGVKVHLVSDPHAIKPSGTMAKAKTPMVHVALVNILYNIMLTCFEMNPAEIAPAQEKAVATKVRVKNSG